MAFTHHFKPAHKEIKAYYEALAAYAGHQVAHEGATSTAFQTLLAATCKKADWHLVPQLATKIRGKQVRPDGTLRDDFNLHRGYWEAKDSGDKLDAEIRKKIALGYPLSNTIFEDTATAVLFQNGTETEPRYDLTKAQDLSDLLNKFYSHTEPDIEGFEQAVDEFKARVPELAQAVDKKIKEAHKNNKAFQAAFETFFDLCRQSLNPNLSEAAVDEMLIQHLLTIRLFDTIFDNPDFVRRNVIAAEVEKVIDALTSKSFSRESFLKSLDRFYVAIESASRVLGEDFTEKQHFLNTVYERFFQGYSVDVADTHGIVYTPQEIVDFMCASVAEVLEKEFGKTLGSKDVNILDPCTGTGNFIVNLIRRVPKRDLPRVYREQLFANEVMLLPYYIAALNIEHAYFERCGEYAAFEGLCFVDTLDLAEAKDERGFSQRTMGFKIEENTKRVEKQRRAPITVIIGNPPYNTRQLDENDNNKNRTYRVIDERIKRTYVKDSAATLKNQLYDPYVRFIRWSTDRLQDRDGIVCLVTNNSFAHQVAFDGVRMHLFKDFARVYHLDLQGNVRHDPNLAGSTYNVFGIQVGVGITIAVKTKRSDPSHLNYSTVVKTWRKEEKLAWLRETQSQSKVKWRKIVPTKLNLWLAPENAVEFSSFVAVGSKEVKSAHHDGGHAIFKDYSGGIKTNRDQVVYDFNQDGLLKRMAVFVENYNAEVDRYKRANDPENIDDFVNYERIKWDGTLKARLKKHVHATFKRKYQRNALYRPFARRVVYFDRHFINSVYLQRYLFPTTNSERENIAVCASGIGAERPFAVFPTSSIPDLNFFGPGTVPQWYPFFIYDKDGTNRRENITDWALQHFREHYKDKKITKWDVCYYVYGILHHPGYRTKFADNLKLELPRIPLAPDQIASPSGRGSELSSGEGSHGVASGEGKTSPAGKGKSAPSGKSESGFRAFSKAGKKLAELHLGYEQLEPWPLKWLETDGVPLSYHVEKMRLSKDKTQLKVNESLTLASIPPEVFGYRLGNRSALDWVIDQYQISTDKRSGITSDPNNPDDEEYIVRLVGQVIRVSVETVRIVNALPAEYST